MRSCRNDLLEVVVDVVVVDAVAGLSSRVTSVVEGSSQGKILLVVW